MKPLPGTKYTIVRELGAGGMGVVYQVVKPPNIQGVLKLMSRDLLQHEELKVRFFDEVRILAQLDHPNIIKVFDYDQLPDGAPFYVMELLNGRTVRDVLHTVGRVPPRVAYEITRQLLEALQAAHTHEIPVIHRDIKPENIFLHAPRHGDPVVKLIDFGVSSVADRRHDGEFVGTWGYAAPEQIRGQRPTPQTDLYAVGLVLYEMLAGRGPFDHHRDWKMLSIAQIEEIPAPVSHFAPWVPPSIVQLIQSVLAKDPNERPRDAHAFADRLYELEGAKAPSSSNATPSSPTPLTTVLTQVQAARGGDAPPVIGAPRTDTFATQHSDATPASKSRAGFWVLAAMLLVAGAAVTLTIVLRFRSPATPKTTATATTAGAAAGADGDSTAGATGPGSATSPGATTAGATTAGTSSGAGATTAGTSSRSGAAASLGTGAGVEPAAGANAAADGGVAATRPAAGSPGQGPRPGVGKPAAPSAPATSNQPGRSDFARTL